MFIAALRTRKGLIVSASVLSVLLHAGLICLLPQFKVPEHQASIAAQKPLSLKLSATSVSNSKPSLSEDLKIKPRQAEAIQETKSQKIAVSEVKKPKPVEPTLKMLEPVKISKSESITKQLQVPKQIQVARQVPETKQEKSSKQAPILEVSEIETPQTEQTPSETANQVALTETPSVNTKMPTKNEQIKPRYQLGSKTNPAPDYPMLARKKGWQGEVVLGVHVAADGSIEHLSFVKSTDYAVLNFAAYETVRNHWRFDPLLNQSEATSSYIEVPISFRFN